MGCCTSTADTRRDAVQLQGQDPRQNPNRQPPRQNGGGARQNQPDNQRQAAAASNGGNSAMRITYLQNPQVEKILQGQTSGEGIKKTPAYETPMTKHELDKWRKEFWETRTSGSAQIWQLLRNACDEDAETAEALILATGLQMPQNSLTTAIDENGVYYRVPIACINEPISYNQNQQYEQQKQKSAPAEVKLNSLKIRSVIGDSTVDATNLMTIKELKQKYLEALTNKDVKIEQLRFFCLGKELKDELFLYTYDIKDEMAVQAMIKKTQ